MVPPLPQPVYLSPATPSELLNHVADHCLHPSHLVICSSQSTFVSDLVRSLHDDHETTSSPTAATNPSHPHKQLLANPLHRVATTRHIRVTFTPTVTHLRAFLAVLRPDDPRSPVQPPPRREKTAQARGQLVICGLLSLHRDTSEWSAQGLGETLAGVVAAGRRCGLAVVACDAPPAPAQLVAPDVVVGGDDEDGGGGGGDAVPLERETMPILSSVARRVAERVDGGRKGWTGRQVEARRVLARWFGFEDGLWERERGEAV